MEELLAHTINAAHAMQAVDARELSRVIVDTTVQEKAIAYPTDSRLLEVARKKLVLLAKRHGIGLRQSYARQGPALSRKAGRYAHARQFKRMRRVLRRQRTVLGRLVRDIQRKLDQVNTGVREHIAIWLERAQRLCTQRPKDKQKLYALHAPEVECIGKGKARQASNSASRSALRSPPARDWSWVRAASRATRTTAIPWPSSWSRHAGCCRM